VKFTQGGPAKYANRAHVAWDSVQYQGIPHGHFHGPVIDAAEFRAAVRKIKATKGWTWREIGVRGGWGPGRLNGVMFGRQRWILRDSARVFLRKVAGMPEPLSAWERRQHEQEIKSGRRAGAEIRRRYMEVG
jgi:hypothetical protein